MSFPRKTSLTPAHERVLRLVLAGKRNREIADETHWDEAIIRKMIHKMGGRERLLEEKEQSSTQR